MCHVLPDIVTDKVARRKASNSARTYSSASPQIPDGQPPRESAVGGGCGAQGI